MKSEIAWLMEAFLEEDFKKLRVMLTKRMAEVTENLTRLPVMVQPTSGVTSASLGQYTHQAGIATQSPSMQRIMAQNPDLVQQIVPVSPAAAQALQARAQAIENAVNPKDEEKRKSPRKF